MNYLSKFLFIRVAIAIVASLAASTASSHAQGATATISDVAAGGGVFDYTIVLENTGTTSLEGFWYAWTLSGNNLSANITNPGSSLGWTDTALVGNTSISYQGNSGNALAVGQSATFTFDSTETPTQITTSPSGKSVVYTGAIGFNQADPGTSSPVFSPTLVVVPEPSSVSLLLTGLIVLIGLLKRLVASRKLRLTPKKLLL